jgi:hypothetical protein
MNERPGERRVRVLDYQYQFRGACRNILPLKVRRDVFADPRSGEANWDRAFVAEGAGPDLNARRGLAGRRLIPGKVPVARVYSAENPAEKSAIHVKDSIKIFQ